jgi:hypothetical protein
LAGGDGSWAAVGHMVAELCAGGKAEGCEQHRGDSAGGLRGRNEPKVFVGWSSAEGPTAAERDAEGDLRGGDEREEGDRGKRDGGGGGRTEQMEARGRSSEIQISQCHALASLTELIEEYCEPKEH